MTVTDMTSQNGLYQTKLLLFYTVFKYNNPIIKQQTQIKLEFLILPWIILTEQNYSQAWGSFCFRKKVALFPKQFPGFLWSSMATIFYFKYSLLKRMVFKMSFSSERIGSLQLFFLNHLEQLHRFLRLAEVVLKGGLFHNISVYQILNSEEGSNRSCNRKYIFRVQKTIYSVFTLNSYKQKLVGIISLYLSSSTSNFYTFNQTKSLLITGGKYYSYS